MPRSGAVDAAQHLLESMPFLDSVSLNAVVAALAHYGRAAETLRYFQAILMESVTPDRITFMSILSACSYAAFVDESWRKFNMISEIYSMEPGEDHYARVVDLLCQAGKFTEARNMIESPFTSGRMFGRLLLLAAESGNVGLGVEAAEKLFCHSMIETTLSWLTCMQ